MGWDELSLHDLVRSYHCEWPDENPVVERFVGLLTKQPHHLFRGCYEDGHVTASGFVINSARDRCLLTHHKKLGMWLQIGGHCRVNELVPTAARREVLEETGLEAKHLVDGIFDLDIHLIPATSLEPVHKHYDVRFCFECDDAESLTLSSESHELRWVPLVEVKSVTNEESIHRMIRKVQRIES